MKVYLTYLPFGRHFHVFCLILELNLLAEDLIYFIYLVYLLLQKLPFYSLFTFRTWTTLYKAILYSQIAPQSNLCLILCVESLISLSLLCNPCGRLFFQIRQCFDFNIEFASFLILLLLLLRIKTQEKNLLFQGQLTAAQHSWNWYFLHVVWHFAWVWVTFW